MHRRAILIANYISRLMGSDLREVDNKPYNIHC